MLLRLWPIAAVLCLGTAGCARPLPNSHISLEALAAAVLDAVESRDAAALRSLALDEREFREHVWPELPASRPERNMPFSYVWTDLRTKSEAGLNAVLAAYGGRRYQLDRVRFTGGATQYETFVVHRESVVEVRDGEGRRETLQLFGSVIEKGGRFKVFSYVVD